MRLQKSDTVSGLPAPVARDFVNHFSKGSYASEREHRLDPKYGTEAEALARLEADGFVRSETHGREQYEVWWVNTITGNALAMTKFTPLLARATADKLLAGAIERARTFNADSTKLATVLRLRVFGSYVTTSEDRIGDLDLAISIERRRRITADEAIDYARASGRNFPSYMEELFWPTREPFVVVKNRSRGISLTTENPALLDGAWQDVYVADGQEPGVTDDWSET
jgi:hypothetical protein